MISAAQIREVVSAYLSHNDGERFLMAFSPLAHNIHQNGDAEAIDLVNNIQSKMADLHAAQIAKADFINFLRHLAVVPFLNVYRISPVVFTGTSSAPPVATASQVWASRAASSILFADKQYA